MLVGNSDHLVGLSEVQRDRLLDKCGLPERKNLQKRFRTSHLLGRDDHGVDVSRAHQRSDVCRPGVGANLFSQRTSRVGVDIRDCQKVHTRVLFREPSPVPAWA